MNVQLHLVADAGGDIRPVDCVALRRQLTAHPELRGHVSTVPRSPAEGEMGSSGMELLMVAVSSGGALTALVATLPALLKARASAASVEVTLADGRSAKVTAESADEARLLLEEAFSRLNPPQT